jgi:hypothetical protein
MYLEKIVETFTYFNMYIIYIIITLTNKKIFFMSNNSRLFANLCLLVKIIFLSVKIIFISIRILILYLYFSFKIFYLELYTLSYHSINN